MYIIIIISDQQQLDLGGYELFDIEQPHLIIGLNVVVCFNIMIRPYLFGTVSYGPNH